MSLFGTDLDDVYALVPEADPDALARVGIGPDVISRWIDELSARVSLRCRGWQRLSTSPASSCAAATFAPYGIPNVPGEDPASPRAQFAAFASTVVANGAASYLEAARHPERAAVADSSYQHVLWTRFRDGLGELAAWIDSLDDAGDPDGDGLDTGLTPRWYFPPPTITTCTRW